MKRSNELEKAAISDAAQLMAVSARTAPKTCGIDNIEVFSIDDGPTRSKLTARMKEISKKESRPSLARDAGTVAGCHAILVLGVRSNPPGLNCGFCGYSSCNELKKSGGVCAFNSIDLGIAVSSAAAAASDLRIDNRLMYSIGRACIDLKMFDKSVRQAVGIPLSATGKNPFFDRKH